MLSGIGSDIIESGMSVLVAFHGDTTSYEGTGHNGVQLVWEVQKRMSGIRNGTFRLVIFPKNAKSGSRTSST